MSVEPAARDDPSSTPRARKENAPTVLQVIPRLETGGAERGACDIAAAIVEAGWTSIVASGGGPMVRELSRCGAAHMELPMFSKSPLTMRANRKRLTDIIRLHNVDIVHARSRAPAWSARAATRDAGAHFVTTFHSHYGASNPVKRYYNGIMAKGERVIAISNFTADEVISRYGADPERVRVIHRGIDAKVMNPSAVSAERIIKLATEWRLPDGVPVIMMAARMTRWKGHEYLIEAMSRLPNREVRCVIVGADQGRERYRAELERQIAGSGLENVMRLVGHCDDMAAAYMLADVVVCPSTKAEAFGRVAAEAQAMGRPVVASNLGAANETVLPDETGWLVPPSDAEALAIALDKALELSPEQRKAMAERAVGHITTEFRRETMCEKTMSVYRELLGSRAE